MEVHHHPHIDSDGHRKKRFKEYLLEFIMIFLAVTLGFLAENIRETLSEKKNAKEYAKLLVNDLNSDIGELNRTCHVLKRIIDSGDSLSLLIRSGDIRKIPSGKLYYYEYWSGWQWKVTPRDATLKQLESSGAMRYLGNVALIKKILDYEETLKIIGLLEDNISVEKAENWSLVQRVFDGFYFRKAQMIKTAARDSSMQGSQEDAAGFDTFVNTNYPLLTYEPNTWMELSNRALTSSGGYRTLLAAVIQSKQKAEDAMDALKLKYRF
jgi:hypothetical protein